MNTKRHLVLLSFVLFLAIVSLKISAEGPPGSGGISVNPTSLSFSGNQGGAAPAAQGVRVTASRATGFTVTVVGQSNGHKWLSVTPSSNLVTNLTVNVSVNLSGLAAGTYSGSIAFAAGRSNINVPVSLRVIGQAPGVSAGYKLVAWNDLGMHCQDGADYSIFAVLPPYNTIHAHLMDGAGKLINTDIGTTVTYEAIRDPLTNTLNTVSSTKTNFWKFAAALGFGSLVPETGLKGFSMPGAANTPQAMRFNTPDNTWLAEGIPIMPYADAAAAPFPVNYFPMMRVKAKNTLGTVLATTDIVLPVSDEMNCSQCHASGSGNTAALPLGGGVNQADPAKDIKLNILRKHDQKFAPTALFQAAATQAGYNPKGLEITTATKPILCAQCHGSNALGLPGATGVEPLTTAMHGSHAAVIEPATGQPLDASAVRDSCYLCHPGPKTQCLRGAMGTLKTASGTNAIECQNCHGSMATVATATRNGWLDEPNCQSCHTGTALANNGQIAYTSVFTSGSLVRTPVDATFATNPNTPASGTSLYRFSRGHGGLQCEGCHGSTHAEFSTGIVNDNVQSTALQGHSGMLAECSACHNPVPATINGGPHGLHPIGTAWVSQHQNAVENGGSAACRACHGTDYRGTILSKVQTDRTMAGKTFAKGTQIGCYGCHNGPNGG